MIVRTSLQLQSLLTLSEVEGRTISMPLPIAPACLEILSDGAFPSARVQRLICRSAALRTM
jgi:hypothetical protein